MSKRPRQDSNLSQRKQDFSSQSPPLARTAAHEIQQPGKYTHLDASAIEPVSGGHTITCTLPPHKALDFPTYNDYEIHYNKTHVNRCLECDRNFPTDHFLNLHIAENHDPLTAARRERGDKTYQCFVEGCDKVCSAWQKRRMHLIAKHMFPPNYDFFIVNDGLGNWTSMLRPASSYRRRGSASLKAAQRKTRSIKESQGDSSTLQDGQDRANSANHDIPSKENGKQADTAMDDIADSMAALKFVPKSLTFGRKQGGGLAKS